MGLLDTSVFIASESGRPLGELPGDVAVSAITIGELQLGTLMAIDVESRFRRMGTLAIAQGLEPVPVDDEVAAEWGHLIARLREAGRSMPLNDSWIAATAIARGMAVVTQDDDFEGVPGLEVIRV
ncbi:MAG: type II toxin-antitoxin system VapC family toxin [Acidimicrobiia bacterium]|nr:type II toxin-antitoxin system VapC family toxin [Acidimicrobiia bacterium]